MAQIMTNNEPDADPTWKRAAIMLWKQLADHKYATVFMYPVSDQIANNYSTVIKGKLLRLDFT